MSVSYRDAMRAAMLYGLLSVLWLLLTDHLLNSYFNDSAQLARWQLINSYVWVFVSAALIFVARARLFSFLGMGARLKRQRQDQERLRQAAVVFDCTREGVLVSDRNGVIVHVNRALVKITGYTPEEVLGQRLAYLSQAIMGRNFIRRCSSRCKKTANGTVRSGTVAKAAKSIRSGRPFVLCATSKATSAITWPCFRIFQRSRIRKPR